MNTGMTGRLAALFALVALSAFGAMACGDDNKDGGSATPAATKPAATAAATKIDISAVDELKDGTLTIGSDVAYAPMEFFNDSNKAVGFDVDLANAMGEALGVKVEFQNAGFDSLLPSLDAKRYDALMSAMTASAERKQTVDFVEYFSAGSGIIVAGNNPKSIQSVDDLCGKTVAAQKATVQVEYLQGSTTAPGGLSQKCKDAGKAGITVREFDTDPEAVQALIAGQADAEMADFPVAAYSVAQNQGKLVQVPSANVDPGNYGIAVRKSSAALKDALTKAFAEVKKNGKYDAILKTWGLEAGKLN